VGIGLLVGGCALFTNKPSATIAPDTKLTANVRKDDHSTTTKTLTGGDQSTFLVIDSSNIGETTVFGTLGLICAGGLILLVIKHRGNALDTVTLAIEKMEDTWLNAKTRGINYYLTDEPFQALKAMIRRDSRGAGTHDLIHASAQKWAPDYRDWLRKRRERYAKKVSDGE